MTTVASSAPIEGKHDDGARVEVLEVESPKILARLAELLPTLEARNGIISPSGALACRLLDAFDEYLDANPVRPISGESQSYFAFSGTAHRRKRSRPWDSSRSSWPSVCNPRGEHQHG